MAQDPTNATEPNGQESAAAQDAGVDTQAETQAAESRLEAVIAESDDLRQKLLRWQADFANLQRRSAKEILESRQRAEGDFAKDLLDVLDHFDAAVSVDPSKVDAATLLHGVKITQDEFKKILTKRGIESFDPTGQPFDPHQHEAVMQEASDKHPAMTVLQTFQRGYRLGDRILRPAKVKVSRA